MVIIKESVVGGGDHKPAAEEVVEIPHKVKEEGIDDQVREVDSSV